MSSRVPWLLAHSMLLLLMITGAVAGEPSQSATGNQSIPELTGDQARQVIETSNIPVIIDFKAVWCEPCKQLRPNLEELQKVYGTQVKIISVDIDQNQDFARGYNLQSYPTLVFVENRQEQRRIQGYKSKAALASWVSQNNAELAKPAAYFIAEQQSEIDALFQKSGKGEVVRVKSSDELLALVNAAGKAGKNCVLDFTEEGWNHAVQYPRTWLMPLKIFKKT